MATFLFDKTVFGPVISRRLGVSLGINLLPNDRKLCTFDCIYCECGWNQKATGQKPQLPSAEEVKLELETKLISMSNAGQLPDVITFAGNGQPTLHPPFRQIVDDTLELRNRYAPKARVAVLSNSTMLHKPDVVEALNRVDDNILKLDSGRISTIKLLNAPNYELKLDILVDHLKQFNRNLTIQTMFVEGEYNGQTIDNTTAEELEAWMLLVKEINPSKLMIYTIERDTAASGRKKVAKSNLDDIAHLIQERLKLKVEVSG
jgi:wyosine [tRNA(Phe)-imidazoG37] synthetase (radical SAM superfamily)